MAKSRKHRWGRKDTAKMFSLFEKGAIPTHLEGLMKEIVDAVRKKHFAGRPYSHTISYNAFNLQYRKRIQEFNGRNNTTAAGSLCYDVEVAGKESHCKLEQSLKNQRKVMDDENEAWNLERRKMESDTNSLQQSLSKVEQNDEDQTNVIKQKDEQIADLLEREQQETKKLAEAEMRLSTDDQEKQNLQNQLTDTNKMYEEARKEMNQMRDQIDKMEIDLLSSEFEKLTLESNQANQSKGAMKNEIDDLKVTVQKLEHESKLVENNLSIKYDSLMEEKNQLEVDFKELLEQMGLEKETAAEEIEEYENQVMELETELETQMKENSDLREELNAKKITDQQMQRQETELAAQEMLSKQLQTLSQSNSDLLNKVKQLSDSQASLSAELDEMKSDCNKKDDQIQQLTAKIIELPGQVDHLQTFKKISN